MKAAGQRKNACPRQHVHVTQVHKSRREERHCRRTERPYTLGSDRNMKNMRYNQPSAGKIERAQPARACTEFREWPMAHRAWYQFVPLMLCHVSSVWVRISGSISCGLYTAADFPHQYSLQFLANHRKTYVTSLPSWDHNSYIPGNQYQ